VTFRRYLVLFGVSVFAATGDSLLSRGMKEIGGVSLHHLQSIILMVLNPTVALGIVFLLAFFACYMTSLSWADLTYVLPATSVSYILLTLLAKFYLHETISVARWCGVLLISAGVGFVTQGPALTHEPRHAESTECLAGTVSPRTQS
jgi:drug/metabolite transporter (DMT)-like permease